jgi:lysine 6-dehydrogenase
MKFAVLGSGMMGYALAFDLAHSRGVTGITLVDSDEGRLEAASERLSSPLLTTVVLNLDSPAGLDRIFSGHACVISAVPYRHNAVLTEVAINAGVHFCDLGGNDQIVAQQFGMQKRAEERNVLVLPNCGLAPGLVNILAARGVELFDSVEEVHMRVGGLPRHPRPPLNYQLVFSVEGLLNEYSGKAKVLRSGGIAEVDAMSEVEAIDFPPPFGTLEAFHTSGGHPGFRNCCRGGCVSSTTRRFGTLATASE